MQHTAELLASAIGDWQVELRQVVMGVLTALLIAHTHTTGGTEEVGEGGAGPGVLSGPVAVREADTSSSEKPVRSKKPCQPLPKVHWHAALICSTDSATLTLHFSE